jgi:hypothetical protein
LFRGLITAIATFQRDGATGGTFFIGFIVVCVATGFVLCALGDFFMLAKVRAAVEPRHVLMPVFRWFWNSLLILK